eukprot:1809247-Prymnesium_polylepis.3
MKSAFSSSPSSVSELAPQSGSFQRMSSSPWWAANARACSKFTKSRSMWLRTAIGTKRHVASTASISSVSGTSASIVASLTGCAAVVSRQCVLQAECAASSAARICSVRSKRRNCFNRSMPFANEPKSPQSGRRMPKSASICCSSAPITSDAVSVVPTTGGSCQKSPAKMSAKRQGARERAREECALVDHDECDIGGLAGELHELALLLRSGRREPVVAADGAPRDAEQRAQCGRATRQQRAGDAEVGCEHDAAHTPAKKNVLQCREQLGLSCPCGAHQ